MKYVANILFSFVILFNYTVCATLPEPRKNLPVTCLVSKSSYQEIIVCAKECRKNPCLSPQDEEKRLLELLVRANNCLQSYNGNTLEDAIKAFLKDFEFSDLSQFILVDSRQTDLGGKSSDRVFLIKDQNGNFKYVVKAFRNPRQLSSKFLPEISSLAILQELSIPNVGLIEPLAFASYNDGDKEWGLLLESVAPGKRLDQYALQVANAKPNSKLRSDYLETAQKAFARIGVSLAKLHKRKSSYEVSIPSEYLTKFDEKLGEIVNNELITSKLSEHFSLQEFVSYVNSVKQEASVIPITYSYWHGDAHLGNMFYDEATDQLTFVDIAKMHYSVDMNGEPLADGTLDLLKVEENLLRISLGHLTRDEIELLLTTFYQAYENHAERHLDPRHLLFYKTYRKLSRLVSYSCYHDEQEPARSINKAVFDSAVDYFKTKLPPQVFSESGRGLPHSQRAVFASLAAR